MIGRASLLVALGSWARTLPVWRPVASLRWASTGEAAGGGPAEGVTKKTSPASPGEQAAGTVALKPFRLEGKPGKRHLWCACGFSHNQPFCDGSHFKARWKGESKKWPVLFKIPENGVAWLCLCKQTGKPPFCDGSHKKIGTAPSESPPSQ